MGLDQYAIRVKRDNIINDLGYKEGEFLSEKNTDTLGNDLQFDYWRNFYPLNDWIGRVYYAKGGDGEFNCKCVRLEDDDLDELHTHAQEDNFYKWGYSVDFKEERKKEYKHLMEFIKKAKKAIQEGDAVYYYTWW